MTLSLICAAGGAAAQDSVRGRELFGNTGGVTGRPVGSCVACHANSGALREMIRNRGGRAADVQSVRRVIERALAGARPGATDAKAQYRGVLTRRDVADLAAYIASATAAQAPLPRATVAQAVKVMRPEPVTVSERLVDVRAASG